MIVLSPCTTTFPSPWDENKWKEFFITMKQGCTSRPAPWGREKSCPTPQKGGFALLCKNCQTLWAAAGQSWFQSIEIQKAITWKDPILSDKYLPHSQISWFTHFLGPTAPHPVNFSLAPPHPIAILWQNYSSSFQNSLMYRYFFKNWFFLELEVLLFQSPVFLSLKIFLLACLQYGLGSLQLLLKTKEIPDPQEKDGVISFTASSNLWNLQ